MKLVNRMVVGLTLASVCVIASAGSVTQRTVYISPDGNTMSANMNVRFSSNTRDFFDISGSFNDNASVYFQGLNSAGVPFSCKVPYNSPYYDEARNLMATISPNAYITVKKDNGICTYLQSQTYSSYVH